MDLYTPTSVDVHPFAGTVHAVVWSVPPYAIDGHIWTDTYGVYCIHLSRISINVK